MTDLHVPTIVEFHVCLHVMCDDTGNLQDAYISLFWGARYLECMLFYSNTVARITPQNSGYHIAPK